MKNNAKIALTILFVALGDAASANAEPVNAELANAELENAELARDGKMLVSVVSERTAGAAAMQAESTANPALSGDAVPAQDLVALLNGYDRTLARSPQDVPAREGRLLVLSKLGLSSEALAEAKMYPQVDPDVVQRIHEDEAAVAIRQVESAYYKPGEETADYDKAILLTEENLKRYPDSSRSRFDMVRALNNRKRYADAVVAYEVLERDRLAIPGYVHEAAGAAYLAEKKPELSEQAYRAAIASNPDGLRANLGLFYALVEQSDFEAAQQHIDAYAAKPLPATAKFDAATAALFERAFEGRLDVAQEGLLTLQEDAPASDQLHLALGRIYLWRGWPRLAQQEFDVVAQRDPDSPSAQAGLVETAVALGDYQSAAERLLPMQQASPDGSDVKTLLRAGEVRDYNELSVLVSGSRSRENLGNGRGVIVESKLLGRPIGYQTRPFIHEYFERGISNDTSFDYRRLGLGAEHTIAGMGVVQAELQQEFYRHKKTSVSVAGRFSLNDYWEVRGTADSNSLAVPLLARFAGISGWSAGAGASWRASERLALHADYSHLDMSDDNKRDEISVRGAATLIQGPVYKGTFGLEFSAGKNSLDNTNYFNPKNEHTVQMSFTSDWLSYQRYSRSFSQRLILTLGRYTEHGFTTRTTGGVGYEARTDLSDTLSANFAIGFIRRVYSGQVSSGPEAHLGFNWKFL